MQPCNSIQPLNSKTWCVSKNGCDFWKNTSITPLKIFTNKITNPAPKKEVSIQIKPRIRTLFLIYKPKGSKAYFKKQEMMMSHKKKL